VDIKTFSDIFEDVVVHVSSRVLNKHATTEHNTLELVVLHPWRRIVSGDESNETSIDVVIVKSGGTSMLNLPDKVAIVEVVPLNDDIAAPADVDGAGVQLEVPRLRDGLVHDVHDAVLVEYQVTIVHTHGRTVVLDQTAGNVGFTLLRDHHSRLVSLPGLMRTLTTVTEEAAEDVDGGDVVTGDTTVRTVTDAAVDDAHAGALASADARSAAVVHHAIGQDNGGLVIAEQTTILSTVGKNAEIHKQSEAFIRHSTSSSG